MRSPAREAAARATRAPLPRETCLVRRKYVAIARRLPCDATVRIVAQVRGKLKRSVLHTLSMAQLWSLLTSPACEVLDVTFAPNLGSARTREQCAALVIYQPD